MHRTRAQSRIVSSRSSAFAYALALSCWLALAAGSAPGSARAQEDTRERTDPAGYSALIDEALAEHAAGNFEEARTLFAKAHAIFPNARTLRGLGMMEFELRDYAASVGHLEQALASQTRALTGELRESTTALLGRAQGFVGKLTLTVEPAEARVLLDGEEVSASQPGAQAGQPLLLNFGEHTLDVRAEGFAREARKVTLRGGESQQVRIVLSPVGLEGGAAGASEHEAASSGPGALPWVLLGAGGALMSGGGVLLALAQSDIDQVEDPGDGARWSESADAYDAAPVKSGIGIALLGVGAAGAAAGLVWALGGSGEQASARGARLHVALTPQRVRVGGSF